MSKRNLSKICVSNLIESKAENIISLNVVGISSFADEIIIATANSNRHCMSVSEKLVEALKDNKTFVIGVEGSIDSGWVLIDCGQIVINIMKKEERDFYDLEGLWGEDMRGFLGRLEASWAAPGALLAPLGAVLGRPRGLFWGLPGPRKTRVFLSPRGRPRAFRKPFGLYFTRF